MISVVAVSHEINPDVRINSFGQLSDDEAMTVSQCASLT